MRAKLLAAVALVSRLDRYGEPLDKDELPVALPGRRIQRPRDGHVRSGVAVAERRCGLCTAVLGPTNISGVCAECRLLVRNLLGRHIEERWRDHPDGVHVVSDQGRVARLLTVDRSHRYPRNDPVLTPVLTLNSRHWVCAHPQDSPVVWSGPADPQSTPRHPPLAV